MLGGAEQPGGRCFSTLLFVITTLSFPVTLIAPLCGALRHCVFTYRAVAALGLRCEDRLLVVAASLVVERGLQARAQLLRGPWDLPDQGLNPRPLRWQLDS